MSMFSIVWIKFLNDFVIPITFLAMAMRTNVATLNNIIKRMSRISPMTVAISLMMANKNSRVGNEIHRSMGIFVPQDRRIVVRPTIKISTSF